MLLIKCHVCGVEVRRGISTPVARPMSAARPAMIPATSDDAEQRDYLFMRHNPKGLHFERWRCDRGCGKWFHAARDTVTMEFKATYGITELPPRDLMRQATGEWAAFFADRLRKVRK
jgi:sarcosine oxidase, subunit delta